MVGNQVQNSPTLERRVPRRSFEGLLLELSPEGSLPPALAAELAAAGLDPSNLRDDYPLATWQDVLSAVHRHRLNGRDPDLVWRELGQFYSQGFLRTAIGAEETVVNDLRAEAAEAERERQESLAGMEAKIAEADLTAERAALTKALKG